MSKSPRLTIEEFGGHLLESRDLDPVYFALHAAKLDQPALKRWLVAYWLFYNVGVASYLSERQGKAWWEATLVAAENVKPAPVNGRWPRGQERRHFRGKAATSTVLALRERYGKSLEKPFGPEGMVDYVTFAHDKLPTVTCEQVMKRTQEHRLFGPWISFKVADMAERVLGRAVSFEQSEVFMFDQPTESALMLWRERMKLPENAEPRDKNKVITEAVTYLTKHFEHVKAPPLFDRPVGLQEVETILCKWKSHMNGHYPLWHDIDEINEGLAPWAQVCKTAKLLMESMPKRASA